MPSKFKYDAAITAADCDAFAVAELKRRFEHHVAKGVYARPLATDASKAQPSPTALRKPIEKDARVVVVLFQWLCGVSSSSAAESEALKARIGKAKRKDV